MPSGLKRYQHFKQLHFVTFSCYRRQPYLVAPTIRDAFLSVLEETRRRYSLEIYGYVVMPEHVHLLLSEPDHDTLADALRSLKISTSKRANLPLGENRLWQTRYYDSNLCSHTAFVEIIRYIHRNPVKRGLASKPEDWKWSSFLHYSTGISGPVEIESHWTSRLKPIQPISHNPPRSD